MRALRVDRKRSALVLRWEKENIMRYEIDFNEDWLFHKGDITVPRPSDKGPVYIQSKTERKLIGPAAYKYFDRPDSYGADAEMRSEGWERVSVPHDYVVDQDLKEHENNTLGFLHYDNAWYRKHFTLEREQAQGKRVLLRFDGIAGKSTVYLNGCLMYHNYSAYNTFEVDISDMVYYDKENVVAVYVNTEEFEGWWYQGGGIYRDVHLTITEPVAIDLWGVYAPYKKISETQWQIDFETTVINDSYEDCNVLVESFVLGENGKCMAKALGEDRIALREKGTLKYRTVIENPALWSPEAPKLYDIKTILKIDGQEIDCCFTRTGFRTVEISVEKGLLINGKKTIIKGVCCHQDFGLTGLAVPENIARYKIGLIKEMGANGFRTSHYQNSAAIMDALDEMGFLVMNEARWFESTKEGLEQMEALVKRDRNRPSVIFWSTSNEEPYHVTDVGKRVHKAMAAYIKKLDNTRFITAAEDRTPEESTIYDECDLIGINYNVGIYDKVHEMRPDKVIFASECCATGTTRDWNYPSNDNGRLRDKDTDTNNWFLGREKTWKYLMERPYVIGGYQWAAVEHRGEAVWPAICSKSGALDLFLQKKGAFYQNKSHWTEEPMVHIVNHWNFGGFEGEDILVTVYTNCDELELFLNGESQGKKQIEQYGHGEWKVPYAPGCLTVKGYRSGKVVAEDERNTTGKPDKLRLTLDNEVKANGKDIALFTCECLDEEGRVVPDASEYVYFSATSPAKIIGTGSDNCDHKKVTLAERKMYMGKIRIAVKPQKGQEVLELTALSDFCKGTGLKIPLKS